MGAVVAVVLMIACVNVEPSCWREAPFGSVSLRFGAHAVRHAPGYSGNC
jgi:hypothetical protein